MRYNTVWLCGLTDIQGSWHSNRDDMARLYKVARCKVQLRTATVSCIIFESPLHVTCAIVTLGIMQM